MDACSDEHSGRGTEGPDEVESEVEDRCSRSGYSDGAGHEHPEQDRSALGAGVQC